MNSQQVKLQKDRSGGEKSQSKCQHDNKGEKEQYFDEHTDITRDLEKYQAITTGKKSHSD